MFQFDDDVTNKLNLYVNKQDQQQDKSNNLTTKTILSFTFNIIKYQYFK